MHNLANKKNKKIKKIMHNLCNASFFFHSCGNFSFSGASASTNFLHLDSHQLHVHAWKYTYVNRVAFKKFQEIPLCIKAGRPWAYHASTGIQKEDIQGSSLDIVFCLQKKTEGNFYFLVTSASKNHLDLISYHPRFSTQEWEGFQID